MVKLIELEMKFGSEEAMGVSLFMDDGSYLSMHEYQQRYGHLGKNGPNAQSVFPDGSSAVCCTDHACQVLKAYPGRVQIWGFKNEDNPTSRVARERIHPGGHDYALLDNRYLIDPWLHLVACEDGKWIFDLADVVDQALVFDIYGPRKCWRRMEDTERVVLTDANQRSVII